MSVISISKVQWWENDWTDTNNSQQQSLIGSFTVLVMVPQWTWLAVSPDSTNVPGFKLGTFMLSGKCQILSCAQKFSMGTKIFHPESKTCMLKLTGDLKLPPGVIVNELFSRSSHISIFFSTNAGRLLCHPASWGWQRAKTTFCIHNIYICLSAFQRKPAWVVLRWLTGQELIGPCRTMKQLTAGVQHKPLDRTAVYHKGLHPIHFL